MNEKKYPENLWKKLILSERSPKIFLHIDDSTPPWLAVQEVLSCCLLFEHRSCTVTVLGWQRHKQSHMFAYCTYEKKMSGSYSFFFGYKYSSGALCAARFWHGLSRWIKRDTARILKSPGWENRTHRMSYCATLPTTGTPESLQCFRPLLMITGMFTVLLFANWGCECSSDNDLCGDLRVKRQRGLVDDT